MGMLLEVGSRRAGRWWRPLGDTAPWGIVTQSECNICIGLRGNRR